MRPRLLHRRWIRTALAPGAACIALAAWATPVHAYPEFQKYSQTTSGRVTNCAMCHTHPDGPDGAGAGQIGGLSTDDLARLAMARAAFEPGQTIDSPILNDFGDHIISTIGKSKFLELRSHPADLAPALGQQSDLDGDGVPDATEYLDGTHPLKRTSGDPWMLFVANFSRFRFHLAMIVLATALTIFGLANILRGAHAATQND